MKVDHRGVSNNQLRKEQPALSERFQHKCIAEQNSLEIAWNMLISDRFKALREGIFASQEEFAHFRQVVVNVVLSTGAYTEKCFVEMVHQAYRTSANLNLPLFHGIQIFSTMI